MKRKSLVFLIAAILAIAVLPAGFAGAAQGTLAHVQPASTFAQSTGFANTDQSGTNVIKFKVTDTDLNTNSALAGNLSTLGGSSALTGKGLILGVGDGSTTVFTVNSAVTPVISPVLLAQDLQSGNGYLAAIGGGGGSITLQPTPADVPSSATDTSGVDAARWERLDVSGVTAAAADSAIAAGASSFSGASRIRVKVTDLGSDSTAAATAVTITLKGTSVNAVTLAQTANDTDALGAFAADSAGTAAVTKTSTKIFLKAGLTFSSTVLTTGSKGFRLQISETRTIVVNFVSGVFNDTDSGAGTTASPFGRTVKVLSTTNSTGLNLALYETDTSTEIASKTTGTFQRVVANYADWSAKDDPSTGADSTTVRKDSTVVLAKGVALIDGALLTTITNRRVAGSAASHQFTDASTLTAVIAALNTADTSVVQDTSTAVDEQKNVAGADWVKNTAVPLGFVSLTTAGVTASLANGAVTWKQLASIVLGVSDSDTVTVTYADVNGTAQTKTIKVDLSKPTITGATPGKNSAVNTTVPQFKATASDVGSGFITTSLTTSLTMTLTPSGGSAAAVTFSAIGTGGGSFDLIAVPATALAVTTGHSWKLVATDRVGNTATTGDLTFAVDNISPTLSSAQTGIGLKLTTGKTTDYEEFVSADWIKLTMSEKVDSATVAALDFSIAGSSPAEVLVVKKVKRIGASAETDRRDLVYLKASAKLDAAAKPKVTITGAISDPAGNTAPTGTATGASATPSDSIKPTLTIKTDVTLGKNKDKVVITVTSDEALTGDVPSIKVDSAGVATTKTGTNAWSATFTIGSTSKVQSATVDASDSAGNAAAQKTAKFQADVNAPTLKFQNADATNKFEAGQTRDVDAATAGLQVEVEDVVFIPVTADDVTPDGYSAKDTHKKVTITTAKLDTLDKLGGKVLSTVTLGAADFQSTNSINFVYGAADLSIGFYKLSITMTDEALNKMAAATSREFQVVAQRKTSIVLNPGWTLVSLPGRPQDRVISSVLTGTSAGQVWSYNNDTQVWEYARLNTETSVWEGTLTQMVDGRAYFVRSTSFDPIKVLLERFSPQRTPPQYNVQKGWNAVGYTPGGKETSANVASYLSSLGTGGWGVIRWWNTTLQQYESATPDGTYTTGFPSSGGKAIVESGKGYLLFAIKDGTIAG